MEGLLSIEGDKTFGEAGLSMKGESFHICTRSEVNVLLLFVPFCSDSFAHGRREVLFVKHHSAINLMTICRL